MLGTDPIMTLVDLVLNNKNRLEETRSIAGMDDVTVNLE